MSTTSDRWLDATDLARQFGVLDATVIAAVRKGQDPSEWPSIRERVDALKAALAAL